MNRILLTIAIVCLAVTPASAALFQNGSFENGLNPPTSGFSTLYGGSTDISGWTVGGHSIDWIGDYWQPAEGARNSVDLNGNAPGSISQAFDTTPGTTYRVTFAMAGNPDSGDRYKDLRVTANGTSADYTFDILGKTHSIMGWDTREFFFAASGSQTTLLTFLSLETDAYGPALGNVTVAPVPAPATIYLLVTGLIGLVGMRRRNTK
jgi:choice-of-anchor C domain-containing protein